MFLKRNIYVIMLEFYNIFNQFNTINVEYCPSALFYDDFTFAAFIFYKNILPC